MSFWKRLIKSSGNDNNKQDTDDLGYGRARKGPNEHKMDDSFKRKVERKIVLSQSDPEPLLDLCECRLESISAQIQSTIKIYGKTDCRFDGNQLTTFGVEPIDGFSGVTALHLSTNRIHTIGQYISQLTHLKELYLSHNALSSLPQSISLLSRLKIVSIRDNEFTQFPDCLTDCQGLSCVDVADNRIARLPPTLLKLKLLKSLQVEGNPVTEPSAEVCAQGLDAIMSELWRTSRRLNDGSEDNSMNCDIDWRTTAGDGTDREKEDPIEDQKKKQLIEWERNFQTNSGSVKESDKKKELLSKLWTEQRAMSADISNRMIRKDLNRKNLLDNITQLETHSKQLLNSLYNWEERHKNQMELLEQEENQLIEMMLKYDLKVDLKKNAILIAMQEMLTNESQRLALSDELKDKNGSEIRNKINEQEQLQRQAFEALQRSRDYRNQSITNQILLVENELTELSRAEMQKRDDRSDCILSEIRAQRAKLAQLLAKLLSQRKDRERQLREQLQQIEERRVQVGDQDFWLVQYQCLMQRQPIEAQIRQFGIDDQIASVLVAVHKDNHRIADYLSLFSDLTFDRLNAMSDKGLLSLGIDDYELCQLIRDKTDEHRPTPAVASASTSAPTAPTEVEAPVIESVTETASVMITELSAQLANVRLWCQTECVVCFDLTCDVVFLPCGHVCTCQTCSHLIQLCPLCRVAIDVKQCLNS